MGSYHLAKVGGHRHCGCGDIISRFHMLLLKSTVYLYDST